MAVESAIRGSDSAAPGISSKETYSGINMRLILTTLGFVAFECVLLSTAADAFRRYVERGSTIVEGGRAAHTAAHHR